MSDIKIKLSGTYDSVEANEILNEMKEIRSEIDNRYIKVAGGTVTGNLFVPTPGKTDNSTKVASTAYVKNNLADYLPLNGGTLTGAVTVERDYASYILKSSNNSNNDFMVQDSSGNNIACMRTQNAGDLTISRKARNGADWYNGAKINLNLDGEFSLTADNLTKSKMLKGTPAGSLTWGDKEIERIASVSLGNNGYYKTENGLILQWGTTVISTGGTEQSVNFNTPFANTNYKVMATPRANGNYYVNVGVDTNLAFKLRCSNAVTVWWLAIGY